MTMCFALRTLVRPLTRPLQRSCFSTVLPASSAASSRTHTTTPNVGSYNRLNDPNVTATRSCQSAVGLGYSVLAKSDVNDLKAFDSIFPDIVNNLTNCNSIAHFKEFSQHYKKMLEYNVPFGKKMRGLAMVASYKLLHPDPENIPKEQLYLANLMGWCIEMFQAFFLVADDIMDQSHMRRGRLCWFRSENVGVTAFNDAILLHSGMMTFLRETFSDQPYYLHVVELFNEVYWKTSVGQSVDLLSSHRKDGRLDFTKFTPENHAAIVKYKTSYYSLYLPVALALHMNGISDPVVHSQANDILIQIGHLFQVQDDFLDCFGTLSETGKLGTDISEGKCSWPAVTALQLANKEQRRIFEDNYGNTDPECVKRVFDLYVELKLPTVYKDYEQILYNKLTSDIQQPSCVLPESIFQYCLSLIYKRRS